MSSAATRPMSIAERRMLFAGRGLLFLLLAFTFVMGCFDLSNGDIWWHLRTGKMIWERGEVPRTDWFTYTNPDSVWLDLHWGFQVIAAALYQFAGGSAALILAKCCLATLTVWVGVSLVRDELSGWLRTALWVPPVVILGWRYNVRPEMFSVLFLVLTIKVLDAARTRPGWLWALPAIQLIWVNMQGLFVLQYVVVGCWVVDRLANPFLTGWKDSPRGRWTTWAAPVATMFAASMLNPYLWRGATLPIMLMAKLRGAQREFFFRFSGELLGFDTYFSRFGFRAFFQQWETALVFFLAAAVLLTLVLLLACKRLPLYRWLLFLAFAYLTWRMTRNAVLFGFVGGIVLCWNVADLIRMPGFDFHWGRKLQWPLTVLTAVGLLALTASLPLGRYMGGRDGGIPRSFGLGEARWYCHDLGEVIRGPGMPQRIYASHLGMAAVCIYHSGEGQRVFADARLETNRPVVLEKYEQVLREIIADDPGLNQTLNFSTIGESFSQAPPPMLVLDSGTLLERPTILQGLLRSGRWRCIFAQLHLDARDPRAMREGVCVFIDKSLAERLGLPAADIEPLLKRAAGR